MNDKKICFILCVNNEVLLSECLEYINRLFVPEGYEIDVLTIYEAKSMCSGYNEAMKSTDAKYKVFMHQDVFIINRFLLHNIIRIFEEDEKIGIIGIAGYKEFPDSMVMWEAKRYGAVPMYGACEKYRDVDFSKDQDMNDCEVEDVLVVDGMLIATSKEIEWDETFDGWDFYDASQCIRYKNHGFKCVVPNQKIPWVVHDDGLYLTPWNYDKYRQLFINRYMK